MIALSQFPVRYLETCLGKFEHWLPDRRIAMNVSKNPVLLLTWTAIRIDESVPVQFFVDSGQWVEAARYLSVTLVKWMTRTAHISQVGGKVVPIFCVLGPLDMTCPSLMV
jgi:hypothetical protein